MTTAKTKSNTLEVWVYLEEHPECENKSDMPPDIYDKVRNMKEECPLCEFYRRDNNYGECVLICGDCVLNGMYTNCFFHYSPFYRWNFSRPGESGNEERAAAAREIVRIVRTMETEE